MSAIQPGWCVIYTKPRHEKTVARQLSRMSMDAYLPTVRRLRKWCDRMKYVELPLFPSYVFVHIPDDKHYFNSLEIDGVLYYVRTGNTIAHISDSVIDHIRRVVSSGEEVEVTDDYIATSPSLLIRDGPFTGYTCEVVEYKGRQKIVVRISLLQRIILLNLPFSDVMPATACYQN